MKNQEPTNVQIELQCRLNVFEAGLYPESWMILYKQQLPKSIYSLKTAILTRKQSADHKPGRRSQKCEKKSQNIRTLVRSKTKTQIRARRCRNPYQNENEKFNLKKGLLLSGGGRGIEFVQNPGKRGAYKRCVFL